MIDNVCTAFTVFRRRKLISADESFDFFYFIGQGIGRSLHIAVYVMDVIFNMVYLCFQVKIYHYS